MSYLLFFFILFYSFVVSLGIEPRLALLGSSTYKVAAFTIKLGDCVPRPPNCGGQLTYSYYNLYKHILFSFVVPVGLEPTAH